MTVGKSTKRFKQFKTKVNTLDLDKLVPILVDWCKLSDTVKNDVVKKTKCDHIG